MLSLVVIFIYCTTTTLGFSHSLSPVQNTRRLHPFVTFNNAKDDTSSRALPAKNTNSNIVLQATEFPITRRDVVSTSFCGFVTNLLVATLMSANAFSAAASVENSAVASTSTSTNSAGTSSKKTIAYKTISLPIPEFGIDVPVSIWYPVDEASDSTTPLPAEIKYSYRISLRRIGQLLAKWDFIPELISKNFALNPSISTSSSTARVVDGKNIPIPATKGKRGDDVTAGTNVVFLAHGFLGSRSDLGHIAEDLAAQGFVCVASEYPESLEASYPRLEGLDRPAINRHLIPYIKDMVPQPILSYSAIGHSLGCGTVLQMGDDSWNRVLMGSGKAPELPSSLMSELREESSTSRNQTPVVGGRLLFITSVNDGPVTSWGGGIRIPQGYTVLQESQLDTMASTTSTTGTTGSKFDRVALVFDRDDAPNHISYLSENVNDAMLSFLSPLLPVTKFLNIPVLDFDKYADSRDSVPTGNVLKPLISNFLLAAPEAVQITKI